MPQIKLTIEYDGTNYVGWQFQPNGISIQEVMEGAIAKVLREPVTLRSSGRTDAGVHARGMVACFVTKKVLPMSAYVDGVNCYLPADIAVVHAEPVSDSFNPRFDTKGKHYRYTVLCDPGRSPLSRLYVLQYKERLDVERMRLAAGLFVGEHDFASFRTSGCAAKTTVRRIDSVTVSCEGDFLHIDVKGSGFMRNMVRIMAGTLVEIGRGKMSGQDIIRCLREPGSLAGPTAPPHGLCLIQVYY
ncbi:MAG: tRNA pseudouridine(38-40) synthase TruA [Geobacteraceae bacterium]|nr:tRNA pseudouridine(38-40) synthase TruA [Geobacteraceae bacterium]